jgi:hypothetical protein
MASALLQVAAAYVGTGLLFALAFAIGGVQRVDPAARSAGWGFRLLILPGSVIFWPLLALRWMAGSMHPPSELNASAARRGTEAGVIRPLRRAHGLASVLLAVVVLATVAAAIALRVTAPVTPREALEARP